VQHFAHHRRSSRPPRRAVWLALLLLPVLAHCGGDDDGGVAPEIRKPEDFLPTDVSAWEQGETCTGTTDGELQEAINGGYTTYARHGMKEFADADFSGTGSLSGATMTVRIFEMNSSQAAEDLYNDPDTVTGTIEENPAVGELARMIGGLATKEIHFVRATYYVSVAVTFFGSVDDARSQALFISGNIDQEISE